jgi:hypothetical protein
LTLLQCEGLALNKMKDRCRHLIETEGDEGQFSIGSGLKSLAAHLASALDPGLHGGCIKVHGQRERHAHGSQQQQPKQSPNQGSIHGCQPTADG